MPAVRTRDLIPVVRPRTRTLYMVGHNMAGYLPDSDNYLVRTKHDAIQASYTDARYDQQSLNDNLERPHTRSYTYTLHGKAGDYWLIAQRGADYHYWYTPSEFTYYPTLADNIDESQRVYSSSYTERCDMCDSPIDPSEPVYTDTNGYTVHADCALGRR